MARKKRPQRNSNTLRIIGGEWRSRKLPFIDAPDLRPTPDRIRETLFNWLQGDIHGASCLDLFAGSGALGFEALSRGATNVVFVENNVAVAAQLKKNLDVLKSEATVIQDDALHFLKKQNSESFDLIFLDPPYRKSLLEESLQIISKNKLLKKKGLIYLEHESEESFDWHSFGLTVLKKANAGQVKCFLLSLG